MEVFGKDDDGVLGVDRVVRDNEIPFPVLYDPDSRNVKALTVTGMPAAFLLDRGSRVVWEGYLIGDQRDELGRRIAELIESDGPSRADLGVVLGASKLGGVTVDESDPTGPAHRAGVRAGDILLSIDGLATANELVVREQLLRLPPGRDVELIVRRRDRLLVRRAKLRSVAADAVAKPDPPR